MSKQLIIILFVIVLVVAGGTYWFLSSPTATTPVTIPTGTNTGSNTFPIGGDRSVTPRTGDNTTGTPNGNDIRTGNGFLANNKTNSKFQELSSEPVAGSIAIERGKSIIVRFIEKATGRVKEIIPGQSEASRIANTTVPKVAIALFDPSGSKIALNTLKDPFNEIVTVLASIEYSTSTTDTVGTLKGVSIPERVGMMAISPDGKELFTLLRETTGGTRGVLQGMDGKNRRELFKSPLSEWLVSWPTKDTVLFSTKPSAGVLGYLYTVSPTTGAMNRLIGNVMGMTAKMSPDGEYLLVTTADKRDTRSYVYKISNQETNALPLKTISDKCAWARTGDLSLYCAVPSNSVNYSNMPDSWYQGETTFTDSFWRINAKTLATTHLGDPEQMTDADNLALDKNDKILTFTNKNTGRLWGLKLD